MSLDYTPGYSAQNATTVFEEDPVQPLFLSLIAVVELGISGRKVEDRPINSSDI
jgi:hypothetical protein